MAQSQESSVAAVEAMDAIWHDMLLETDKLGKFSRLQVDFKPRVHPLFGVAHELPARHSAGWNDGRRKETQIARRRKGVLGYTVN